jgi:hypothetical protein
VQDGEQFVPLKTEMGRQFPLPEEFSLKLTDLGGATRDYIDFYPTGRTEPGTVEITSTLNNDVMVIRCPSPTEAFRLVQPGDGR